MPTIALFGGTSVRGYGQRGFVSSGPPPIVPTVSSFSHIETLTVSSGTQATLDFSSIPSTYKHLQLRAHLRSTRSENSDYVGVRLNNDSSSTYYRHVVMSRSHNTNAQVLMDSQTYGYIHDGASGATAPSNLFGACVFDILDYTSTTTRKSILSLSGAVNGTSSGVISISSLLWPVANVVNRVTLICNAQFAAGSTVSLYGLDGTL